MNADKKLTEKELEQVSGGWEYQSDKYQTWLNGYNIQCPYCGNEEKDVVQKHGGSPSEVYFECDNCGRSFIYRWDRMYNKIKLITH